MLPFTMSLHWSLLRPILWRVIYTLFLTVLETHTEGHKNDWKFMEVICQHSASDSNLWPYTAFLNSCSVYWTSLCVVCLSHLQMLLCRIYRVKWKALTTALLHSERWRPPLCGNQVTWYMLQILIYSAYNIVLPRHAEFTVPQNKIVPNYENKVIPMYYS